MLSVPQWFPGLQAALLRHRLKSKAVYSIISTIHDAHYLALAQTLDCEFWTADERLYNAVRDQLPWVRWLGLYDASFSDTPY